MMTTSTRPRRRRATAFALVGLILGALLIGLEVRQGAPVTRAAGGMAILFVFIGVIWVFQTRSETVSALAGQPVDERWQLINQRAAMAATGMAIVVALVGFAVMEVSAATTGSSPSWPASSGSATWPPSSGIAGGCDRVRSRRSRPGVIFLRNDGTAVPDGPTAWRVPEPR